MHTDHLPQPLLSKQSSYSLARSHVHTHVMAAENFPVGQRLRSAALTARNEQSPPLRGLWLSSSSPACATTLARLRRLDFLIVDWEHGDGGLDRGQVDFLVREIFAQSQSRTAPIVRLPSRGAVWTKWALDAGA